MPHVAKTCIVYTGPTDHILVQASECLKLCFLRGKTLFTRSSVHTVIVLKLKPSKYVYGVHKHGLRRSHQTTRYIL